MNCNIYFFIGTHRGYSQYPNNYTKDIISNILSKTDRKKNLSQFAISMNGKLVYMTYQYRYSDSKYIGICCEYNNVVPTNFKYLFEFFDNVVLDILNKGDIIHYDSTGNICPSIDYISDKIEIVNYYSNYISNHLNDRLAKYVNLPLRNYTSTKKESVFLAYDDNQTQLTVLLNIYNNVIISHENPYVLGYTNTLKKLSEKLSLLENELTKIKRKKKQYRWVAILSICIVVCLIGLYFLNNNLSNIISNQSSTISKLESTVAFKNSEITALHDTISEERDIIKQRNNEIRLLNKNLKIHKDSLRLSLEQNIELSDKLSEQESKFLLFKNTYPINITNIEIGNSYRDGRIETNYGNTIYSHYTMYLKPRITYTGINIGRSIKLKIRWYYPNGTMSSGDSSPSGFSQQQSLYVYSGSNTEILAGWGNQTKGHWKKGTYRIEIWYENVCLKAKSFTIY